jgi:hypothetical protein
MRLRISSHCWRDRGASPDTGHAHGEIRMSEDTCLRLLACADAGHTSDRPPATPVETCCAATHAQSPIGRHHSCCRRGRADTWRCRRPDCSFGSPDFGAYELSHALTGRRAKRDGPPNARDSLPHDPVRKADPHRRADGASRSLRQILA